MADLQAVKAQVQSLLTNDLRLNGVTVDEHGWSFRVDSARVFVGVFEQGSGSDTRTVINIFAPVGLEVPLTPKLYEYVALNADNLVFGHLSVKPDDDVPGTGYVLLSHRLLGDFLDPPEFKDALLAVAGSGEELDDQIVAMFGGHRRHED
jgi:hypothetical protein